MATELPSSVSLDYIPQTLGPGTITQHFEDFKIIELDAHRRKAGNLQPRTMHIVDNKGQISPKTVRVEQQGEYSTIHVKDHGTNILGEIQVNGTHLRINDGQNEGKYSFSGQRIAENEHAVQIPLEGYMQLTFDDAVLLNRYEASLESPLLPNEIDRNLITLLVDVAHTVRDPKTTLDAQTTLRLGGIFQELTSPTLFTD